MGRTLAVLMTMTLGTSMVAHQGSNAMAAHQICMQVRLAVSLLSDSLAASGKALVASYSSRGDFKTVKEITNFVLKIGVFTSVFLAVILGLSFGSLATVFTKDVKVLDIVTRCGCYIVYIFAICSSSLWSSWGLVRYLLRRSALELFMVNRSNFFFDFGSTEGRRNAYLAIVQARPPHLNNIYLATQQIWDEVGESDEERDRMLLQIEKEWLDVYKRKVEQAVKSMAQLLQALSDSKV
ncbi:hypothetical protein LWI29_015383 [Acer saccharum]|uniref:BEACH-type PH domain-containing protein n=1 Tax=Acer saccharum TaxID=4024 RepID=A0AA39VKG1_ACESA|nr:hypothetical protein LWI29_015383 [Acer saccharum]